MNKEESWSKRKRTLEKHNLVMFSAGTIVSVYGLLTDFGLRNAPLELRVCLLLMGILGASVVLYLIRELRKPKEYIKW